MSFFYWQLLHSFVNEISRVLNQNSKKKLNPIKSDNTGYFTLSDKRSDLKSSVKAE